MVVQANAFTTSYTPAAKPTANGSFGTVAEVSDLYTRQLKPYSNNGESLQSQFGRVPDGRTFVDNSGALVVAFAPGVLSRFDPKTKQEELLLTDPENAIFGQDDRETFSFLNG